MALKRDLTHNSQHGAPVGQPGGLKEPAFKAPKNWDIKRPSQAFGYFWVTLRRAKVQRTLLWVILFLRHLRTFWPLFFAARGSPLHRFVKARPEVFEMALAPYVAANWDTPTKIARIINHCETAATMSGVVDFPLDDAVELIRLTAIDARYRLTIDQSRWLLREGQLVFGLWDGIDRIFHLSFCLATEAGKRVAYIGCLQGRPQWDHEPNIMDRYRVFTKLAFGTRPRDFIVEVFKMFCRELNIAEIRAISDLNTPDRSIDDIKLSYDEVWRERGGVYDGNGFFIIPVTADRRSEENIPAKKRAMYRKRYSMLADIEKELAARLKPMARGS